MGKNRFSILDQRRSHMEIEGIIREISEALLAQVRDVLRKDYRVCSFCLEQVPEGRKIVGSHGTNHTICEHCIAICEDSIAKRRNTSLVTLATCSFCGKGQREVKALLIGPGLTICDECVALCAELTKDQS